MSSELGLVVRMSCRARAIDASSRCGGQRGPRWSIADCVRLPMSLCVPEITTCAPAASASCGRRSWKRKCAPQASSTTSATPRSSQTSARPRMSAAAPKYVGLTTKAARAPGVRSSASASSSAATQCAIPSSSSSPGTTNAGRAPLSTRPWIVLECTLRWTTTSRQVPPSATQSAWPASVAPLTRNHVRRAPQVAAASRCARASGGSAPPMSIALDARGDVERQAVAERRGELRRRAAAALVGRDVEAGGPPRGVALDRLEVRSPGPGGRGLDVGRGGRGDRRGHAVRNGASAATP